MSESLKELATMPEYYRELLGDLPNSVADKALEDAKSYIHLVETIKEQYEGMGMDEYESKPLLIIAVTQHYEPDA